MCVQSNTVYLGLDGLTLDNVLYTDYLRGLERVLFSLSTLFIINVYFLTPFHSVGLCKPPQNAA